MFDFFDVAHAIRAYAETAKLTQGELAARAGLSPTVTALFLRGYVPSFRTLAKLASAIDCEVKIVLVKRDPLKTQTTAKK